MAVTVQDRVGKVCNESITDMEVDFEGNIFITGNLQYGTVDFDPSSGVLNVNGGTSSNVPDQGNDLFVASYNSSGQVRFAYAIEDSRIAYSLMDVEQNCTNYILSGNVGSHISLDFDPSPDLYIVKPGIYIIPLNRDGLATFGECGVSTNTIETNSRIDLRLYPNPSEEYIYISYKPDNKFDRLQINDALGRIILETRLDQKGFASLECVNFRPGIYCVSLWKGDYRESIFFVKN